MDPLGDALKRELKSLGPNSQMSEILAAWPEAVGAEIARNAWPARFQRDGTLIVHTKDAIWSFELGHRAAEISGRLPATPALKFVAGPLPEPGAALEEAPPTPPAATLEEQRQAAEWAATIEDEGLRDAVQRAAAASLARRPD
jgi:hypothetical protein